MPFFFFFTILGNTSVPSPSTLFLFLHPPFDDTDFDSLNDVAIS